MQKIEFKVSIEMEQSLVAFYSSVVQTAMRYTSDMTIAIDGGNKIDLKSVLGLMSVALINGRNAVIEIEGEDEEAASFDLGTIIDKYKK